MARYFVVICPNCGEIQAAEARHRHKTCVRCGHRFEVRRARILGVFEGGRVAAEAVKKFKEMRGGEQDRVWRRGSDYT